MNIFKLSTEKKYNDYLCTVVPVLSYTCLPFDKAGI